MHMPDMYSSTTAI